MFNKSIDDWLADYGESHRHPSNKLIHWLCVPAILWCVLALLWELKLGVSGLNGASVLIALSLAFYARLSGTLMLGMGLVMGLCIVLIIAYERAGFGLPLWSFAALLFVIAWVGQFIGHRIEGKKPSFFKDLQFLLIGPAWLLGFVYRKLGIPLRLRRAEPV